MLKNPELYIGNHCVTQLEPDDTKYMHSRRQFTVDNGISKALRNRLIQFNNSTDVFSKYSISVMSPCAWHARAHTRRHAHPITSSWFFFISKNQKADKKSLYFVKIWRLTKECVCPPPFFLPNVLILVDLKS